MAILYLLGEHAMLTWTTPQVIEVCLGCEINCYMSAEG